MSENRYALIIGCNKYTDPRLQKLDAPAQDVKALEDVLKNKGRFEVKPLIDAYSYEVNREIERFFRHDRNHEDLLLLYFSCHGIKSEDGNLFFAAVDTDPKTLYATSISADFVNQMMQLSRSRRQMLLLDCCYGGAFGTAFRRRADDKINTRDYFQNGLGIVVITASDERQFAFEGDNLNIEKKEVYASSIFTRALVHGLNTWEADDNGDGLISHDELYEYVYERVRNEKPEQHPQIWTFGIKGEIIVAHDPYQIKKIEPRITFQRNRLKIFVSYTGEDLHYAIYVKQYLERLGHEVINMRYPGDSSVYISNCDAFVLIYTRSALIRGSLDKQVLEAKRLGKRIIPCVEKTRVFEEEILSRFGLQNAIPFTDRDYQNSLSNELEKFLDQLD